MIEQGNLSLFTSPFPTTPVNVDGSQVGFVEDSESDNLTSPQNDSEVELKRKHTTLELEAEEKLKAAPKKKVRVSKDRGKKIIESKQNDEEDESNNKMGERENSDDESKACEQNSEGENSASKELIVVTSKGKKRANRGSATDPQSLYARRRREKINERLKILQNLVPNGTKVDISTMLEEAVQYVKFLQLQIRLLSSDDFWMYAPIAYNGVDISLYKRISPFLLA
ncbi:hypothetical protein BVRB_1g015220 [Beta vulgaris subsp. vulgaris]|nr:hypothetical protein BVRB_1g015220 [Beta vulgaris subsp. vulgaris]